MSRGGVNEVIPGLLFQRANFLNWPRRQKQAMLARHGIRVVVNLWHKADPDLSSDAEGTLLYLNWHIAGDTVPDHAKEIIQLLLLLLHDRWPILIHCEAGSNRSVWLAAELVRRWGGVTGEEALEMIQSRVPGAKINRHLREALYNGHTYR